MTEPRAVADTELGDAVARRDFCDRGARHGVRDQRGSEEMTSMTTLLDQLNSMTVAVADTGDINSIEKFKPRDATTNPSLITAAAQMPEYADVVDGALRWAESAGQPGDETKSIAARDRSPGGRVRPAHPQDRAGPRLDRGRRAAVVRHRRRRSRRAATSSRSTRRPASTRDRVLIKIASTWEGIRAAEILEKEGIHCNLTLLFGMHQAVACAEAGVRADLAVRRPHPRLVQEGRGPRAATRPPRIRAWSR